MEYMNDPGSKVKRSCRVIQGTHLTFVMEGNTVRLCTSNLLKLLWFLGAFQYTVLSIKGMEPCVACPKPNYG